MRNSTGAVFTKSGNSEDVDGKSESHTVFHCGFYESLASFCVADG